MPIMVIMEWKGVTPEEYEQVRASTKWESDVPKGALFHVSSFGDGAMHITDLWESPQEFDAFVQQRLTPNVQAAGIQTQPEVRVYPVHAIFNPYPEKLKV